MAAKTTPQRRVRGTSRRIGIIVSEAMVNTIGSPASGPVRWRTPKDAVCAMKSAQEVAVDRKSVLYFAVAAAA